MNSKAINLMLATGALEGPFKPTKPATKPAKAKAKTITAKVYAWAMWAFFAKRVTISKGVL